MGIENDIRKGELSLMNSKAKKAKKKRARRRFGNQTKLQETIKDSIYRHNKMNVPKVNDISNLQDKDEVGDDDVGLVED